MGCAGAVCISPGPICPGMVPPCPMRPCIIWCIIPMQDCMFCIMPRHCSGMPCIIWPIGICDLARPWRRRGGECGGCAGVGCACAPDARMMLLMILLRLGDGRGGQPEQQDGRYDDALSHFHSLVLSLDLVSLLRARCRRLHSHGPATSGSAVAARASARALHQGSGRLGEDFGIEPELRPTPIGIASDAVSRK